MEPHVLATTLDELNHLRVHVSADEVVMMPHLRGKFVHVVAMAAAEWSQIRREAILWLGMTAITSPIAISLIPALGLQTPTREI